MARITPADRAAKIAEARKLLPGFIKAAVLVSEAEGYDSLAAHKAWEAVEEQGATIHRQARLLAGKKRGG